MSHPLIVEAAETLFVPACVYNNTSGDADEAVLKSFEERAWNNPVVRVIDAQRQDLVPRIANRWTADALAGGMIAALEKAGRDVPEWLRLFEHEARTRRVGADTAIFGMA